MDLILISTADYHLSNEIEKLHEMFKLGLKTFHIRKPNFTALEYENYIRSINPEYHPRLMIHSHHHLKTKFNIKGIHYTEKSRPKYPIKKMENLVISTSFHELKQLKEENYGHLNYAFLSPIYNSISKQDYKKKEFDTVELKKQIKNTNLNIYGLGGVELNNINHFKNLGFFGIAVLGAIWLDDDPVIKFCKILEALTLN